MLNTAKRYKMDLCTSFQIHTHTYTHTYTHFKKLSQQFKKKIKTEPKKITSKVGWSCSPSRLELFALVTNPH